MLLNNFESLENGKGIEQNKLNIDIYKHTYIYIYKLYKYKLAVVIH